MVIVWADCSSVFVLVGAAVIRYVVLDVCATVSQGTAAPDLVKVKVLVPQKNGLP
jgi:hypothetical protein